MDLLSWLFNYETLRSKVYPFAVFVKMLCYLAIFILLTRAIEKNRKVFFERFPLWLGAIFLTAAISSLLSIITVWVVPVYSLQAFGEVLAVVPAVLFLLHRKRYAALVGATVVRQELIRKEAELVRLEQELNKHTGQVTERTARLERLSYDLQRTNQELETRSHELSALLDVFEVGAVNMTLEEFLDELMTRIIRGMETNVGVILLKEGPHFVVKASVGVTGETPEGAAPLVGDRFVVEIIRRGVPLVIEDAPNDPRVNPALLQSQPVASVLGAPLRSQEKTIGVVYVGTTEPHPFSPEEIRRFEVMLQRMAIGVENITMYTELRNKSEELAAKNRELESFVYTVSHDLKTPLVTLQGFVSSLVEDYGPQLDEVAQRYLDYVGEAAIRMERLLSGLLNLSRIGRVIHAHTLIPFEDIVNNALVEINPLVDERRVELRLPSRWPKVFCDRERMTEVMVNLLSNAVKFMGPRQSPWIELGYDEQNGHFRFFVKDNGIGIDAVYFQKIFEPFQRLVEVNGAEGTGLGLAIVRKIVEAHGGSVWVESQKGQGSVFYFTIPKRE